MRYRRVVADQEPEDLDTDSRPRPRRTRGWDIFVAVQAALLTILLHVLFLTWNGQLQLSSGWTEALVALTAWLLVLGIPISLLYLASGADVMYLFRSPRSRAYEEELLGRDPLDAEAFFTRYYAGTGIPRSVPIRVRKALSGVYGPLMNRVHPDDVPFILDDEFDPYTVMKCIAKEAGVRLNRDDCLEMDGSFDSIVWLITRAKPALLSDRGR